MTETVLFDYMSPHCNPELEDSKPIFLHDTLAHDDASLQKVWLLTEGSVVEEILSRWIFTGILNLFSFLWPWPKQSYPICSQDNPAKDDVQANQV